MGNSQCIQEPEEDTAHNDISYDFFCKLGEKHKSNENNDDACYALKLFTILDGACQSHSVSIADVSAGRDAAADTGDFDAGRFDEP